MIYKPISFSVIIGKMLANRCLFIHKANMFTFRDNFVATKQIQD